jgi:hypothetical protein
VQCDVQFEVGAALDRDLQQTPPHLVAVGNQFLELLVQPAQIVRTPRPQIRFEIVDAH